MCLQVCWKGKFKAFQFLCSYSICINKHQGDGIPFFLFFFGVKLRSTVWIFAILKTVPKMRSLVFVFIFVWTLKALKNSIVTVRFPCFPAPFYVSKIKNSFLLGWMDARHIREQQLCPLPQTLRLTLDHLQILPWLSSFNFLYFAGCKYIALFCWKEWWGDC